MMMIIVMYNATLQQYIIVCLGWGAGGLVAGELGGTWCREAVLGGGVRGIDC